MKNITWPSILPENIHKMLDSDDLDDKTLGLVLSCKYLTEYEWYNLWSTLYINSVGFAFLRHPISNLQYEREDK